ncbi:coiled-coil domain-containing protein [Helicobacter trogontum]|uniref:coiled-coil domain-containing protein n=1 Tax=Helicobacter trogontum TaxID=50960 RepID=UPI002A91A0CB|nr:coiled-coil domain-containing protein [Helicobacter trogontum]MDY5185364.1 coiled-coil domain-containing protein [Helicobacter trogontum]
MSVNFNESFKALVREVFQDKSQGVIHILDEVVSNKASEDIHNINNLKQEAIKDIRSNIATNDFVRAEIAELKAELKQDIADLRSELKQDIADLREEVHAELAKMDSKIMQFRAELKQDNANLKAELKEDIAKSKVDIIKWVFGLQFATLALIAGMLKLML